jgi:hypothetical protein
LGRSESQAETQTRGAFQLIATSLTLKARASSIQQAAGAQWPRSAIAVGSLASELGPPESTPGGDYARAYLDLMLSYRQLGDVLAWGMTDNHSWLQQRPPRADGLPKRPTPYGSNYGPKPLRQTMAASFRNGVPRTSSAASR